MAKYLRINEFRNVTPSGLDGHKYRLEFDIGDHKSDVFTSEISSYADIEISGTLETIWGLDDVQIRNVIGSICITNILELAKNDDLELLKPIILNTFTSGKVPPSDLYISTVGSIISFPERVKDKIVKEAGTTFLRYDISDIRDHINTYTKKILGKKILLINQERALFDMYKSANSNTQFVNRISSLAGLIISIDKKTIGAYLNIPNTNDFGEIIILEQLLTVFSNKNIAKNICIVFKKINDLRKGYPIHGDNIDRVLPAHDYFDLTYPIVDYKNAWEKILNSYLESMIMIREIIIDYYQNKYRKKIEN